MTEPAHLKSFLKSCAHYRAHRLDRSESMARAAEFVNLAYGEGLGDRCAEFITATRMEIR